MFSHIQRLYASFESRPEFSQNAETIYPSPTFKHLHRARSRVCPLHENLRAVSSGAGDGLTIS